MPIGPSLPPHLAHLSARDSPAEAGPSTRSTTPPIDPESEDEDDYGPALPPHLAAKRALGPTLPSAAPPSASAPAPSRPQPAAQTSRQPYEDDDESDDDIGPKPPGEDEVGPEKSAVEEFLEREKRRAEQLEEKEKPKVLKREEWMLVPPEAGVLSHGSSLLQMITSQKSELMVPVDPLRKRPSTFNRTNVEAEVDNTVWTETPAEKHQRLADEAAGIKRNKVPKKGERDEGYEAKGKRQREEEIRQEVERHTVCPFDSDDLTRLMRRRVHADTI